MGVAIGEVIWKQTAKIQRRTPERSCLFASSLLRSLPVPHAGPAVGFCRQQRERCVYKFNIQGMEIVVSSLPHQHAAERSSGHLCRKRRALSKRRCRANASDFDRLTFSCTQFGAFRSEDSEYLIQPSHDESSHEHSPKKHRVYRRSAQGRRRENLFSVHDNKKQFCGTKTGRIVLITQTMFLQGLYHM